ncbi:MAG: hypothetical protein AAF518_27755 [Spirochaetota bacterium]
MNGTNKKLGSTDELRVLVLQNGMQQIAIQKDVKGKFTFANIEVPENLPLMLQAVYQGATYNKLIPPVPAMRNKEQKLVVYEKRDSLQDLKINSLLQIVKESSGMRVYKIFLLDNVSNPPRAIANDKDPFLLYIPPNAQEISAHLKQGKSQMGIPLQLQKRELGQSFPRAILPGHSELEVSFLIREQKQGVFQFSDRMLFKNVAGFRPIFLKPKDIQVNFLAAKKFDKIENDIPQGLQAFRVYYPLQKEITFQLQGGTSVVQSPARQLSRRVVNGSIFTSQLKSTYATLAILGLLFSFSFLFVYKNRLSK